MTLNKVNFICDVIQHINSLLNSHSDEHTLEVVKGIAQDLDLADRRLISFYFFWASKKSTNRSYLLVGISRAFANER